MKPWYFLTIIILSIGCSNPTNNKQNEDNQFDLYRKKFPEVNLPISIKGCKINYSNLEKIDSDKFEKYVDSESFIIGEIKSNGNYIALLTLGTADCLLPRLTTYKKDGEKIDSRTIAIGYCGEGPCFECEEYAEIKPDYSIFTADTMKTSECDEEYNAIPNTEKIEIIYRIGSIDQNGKIALSEEIKKEL